LWSPRWSPWWSLDGSEELSVDVLSVDVLSVDVLSVDEVPVELSVEGDYKQKPDIAIVVFGPAIDAGFTKRPEKPGGTVAGVLKCAPM